MAKGKKTGGRIAGTRNKDRVHVFEVARKLKVDPFEILLHFARGDWQALGYKDKCEIVAYSKSGEPIIKDVISAGLRATCASDACEYLYPKLKAIEHTGKDGEPIKAEVVWATEFGSSNESNDQ